MDYNMSEIGRQQGFIVSAAEVTHAICREVPATFDRAVVQSPSPEPIQASVAQEQHRAYVRALEAIGLHVQVLPADAQFPDCCFVEDCAVVAEGVALVARLGADSRRGEETAIAAALAPHASLEPMNVPATLDGGDCLRLGKRWYVGRSQRTNAAGIARLRSVFAPLGFEVIEVALDGILHLKCVCSRLDDETMLLAEGSVPPEIFRDVRILRVPAGEAYAANCLSVRGTVLMPAGFPNTRRVVEAAGFPVIELDHSEIRKADGAMTCLSIVV
jgi:dimethylargininase